MFQIIIKKESRNTDLVDRKKIDTDEIKSIISFGNFII